jgi:hypothetical protein
VVREGVGAGGRNDPALYAHMNNKRKKKRMKRVDTLVTFLTRGNAFSFFPFRMILTIGLSYMPLLC